MYKDKFYYILKDRLVYAQEYLVDTTAYIQSVRFQDKVKKEFYRDKIYAIDMNNVLRCYSIKNGDELWNFRSEDTFLKSNKRNSIAIKDGNVFFNNSLGAVFSDRFGICFSGIKKS